MRPAALGIALVVCGACHAPKAGPDSPELDGKPVALGDGWATSTLDAEGIDPARIGILQHRIERGELRGVDSVLIVRHERLCYEAYWSGGPNVLHELQSATKSVTSALVGAAIQRGFLTDVEQPVSSVLPSFAAAVADDPGKARIRLVDLLTMSSGLDWDESWPYDDPRNTLAQMNASRDWEGYVLSRRAAEAPGTRFVYDSGGVILLGAVLRAVTGGDIAALAEAQLFAPMQVRGARWSRNKEWPTEVDPGAVLRAMSSEDAASFAEGALFSPLGVSAFRWFRNPYRPEQVHTGGGLSLSPRDQAKFGQLYLAEGLWLGRRILPAEWVRESTRPRLRAWDAEYGFLWWLRSVSGDVRVAEAWGARGQHIFVVGAFDLVVVVNGHDDAVDAGLAVLGEILAATR
jgi:CubicO group peptidase (beta-lactamase class C family)